MTDLLLRLGLLGAVMRITFLTVSAAQRRTGSRNPLNIPPGLLVVTGPECRWCDRLLNVLQTSDIAYHLLDHSQAATRGIVVRSLPTALVVASDGTVTMRRSGPATLDDVNKIAARVRAAITPQQPRRRLINPFPSSPSRPAG